MQSGESQQTEFDVVICGGGLAGLTLARQLRQELPQLRVALVERMARPLPEAAHKVGESSVELASQYFERLGLRDYLLEHQIVKFGLRFFPGGGQLPIEERAEVGPSQEPPVRSYQLDRGKLENDLREMNESDGVHMYEGYSARDVEFGAGDESHRVLIERAGEAVHLTTRWVIDATGRHALLRRKLELKRGTGHAANAGWFRVEGRLDVTEFVERTEATKAWHEQPFANLRWRSTTHFMGDGYWVWFIPLSSGNTSVGVVTHDELHGFNKVRTLEACMNFLREHEPHLVAPVEQAKVIDFCCLHNYSHNAARCWSTERWGLVGEAGAFVDPLYSPGSDFIAFANCFTVELIKTDLARGDMETRVRELNLQYRALVMGAVNVFKNSARVYGHASGMSTKIYWDNFAYWSFPCQYFLQRIYQTTGEIHTNITMTGARFVELSGYIQMLLRAWAELVPELPKPGFRGLPQFPSMLVDAHLDLQKRMTPEETHEYIRGRVVQGEEIVTEIVLRVLATVGPTVGAELLERAGASKWMLTFDAARFDKEAQVGVARRHELSAIARDVERNLGMVAKHPEWRAALRLLEPGGVVGSAENSPRGVSAAQLAPAVE